MSLPHNNNKFNKRSIDSISHTGDINSNKEWNNKNENNTTHHTRIQTLNHLKNTLHFNLKALGLNILRQNSLSLPPSLHSSLLQNRNNTSHSNRDSGSYNSNSANTTTTHKRQKVNNNLPRVVAPTIHVMATTVPRRRSSVQPALVSRVLPSAAVLRPSPCTSITYKGTHLSSLQNNNKKKSTPSRNIVVDSIFSIEQTLFFEPFLLSPSLFSHLIQQGDRKSN